VGYFDGKNIQTGACKKLTRRETPLILPLSKKEKRGIALLNRECDGKGLCTIQVKWPLGDFGVGGGRNGPFRSSNGRGEGRRDIPGLEKCCDHSYLQKKEKKISSDLVAEEESCPSRKLLVKGYWGGGGKRGGCP